MKYRQLTEGVRYQIALLFGEKISLTEISKRVGVSKSTVSRELRRNSVAGDYSAAETQRLSEARRRSAARRSIGPDTVFYVETGLCWKWSPEQISAICKRIGSPAATNGFTSMFRPIKPMAANYISICDRVNAVTARATEQSAGVYPTRYLSSSALRWLMSVAAWVTGKQTLCWVPRVRALS